MISARGRLPQLLCNDVVAGALRDGVKPDRSLFDVVVEPGVCIDLFNVVWIPAHATWRRLLHKADVRMVVSNLMLIKACAAAAMSKARLDRWTAALEGEANSLRGVLMSSTGARS